MFNAERFIKISQYLLSYFLAHMLWRHMWKRNTVFSNQQYIKYPIDLLGAYLSNYHANLLIWCKILIFK